VLHCHHLVGGQSGKIALCERALGARSRAISLEPSPFGYQVDQVLTKPGASFLRREVGRWQLLVAAVLGYDVIHYNFGSSILRWRVPEGLRGGLGRWLFGCYAWFNRLIELPLLRLFGRVIAVTYQGDDARQGGYCRHHQKISIAAEVGEGYYTVESDEAKRRSIVRFGEYADLIYALNPDLMPLLPGSARYLPYGHIDLEEWRPVEEKERNRPLVVHAPSHRGVKGTRFILTAVESLRRKGVPFDFQLVEGMSRMEARRCYERADLVVDQLLAGWYGGLAVEAMALGKPVICYLRDEDLQWIPEGMRRELPLIEATPGSVEEVLQSWILQPKEERIQKGKEGRRFVERWHDPYRVASALLKDYGEVLDRFPDRSMRKRNTT